MRKIAVQELIDYSRKTSEKSKRIFADRLKSRLPVEKKETNDEGAGGDYWITSTSCIYNVIKNNSASYYDLKIEELLNKIEVCKINKTKLMYRRNMDILTSFRDFHYQDIRPGKILLFERLQKVQKIYTIEEFPLFVSPNIVFIFEENGQKQIGAIWLVAKINGFKKSELGIFCELLNMFLLKNYSDTYQISERYCTAVDTYRAQSITYAEMVQDKTPFLLNKILQALKS